VLRILVQLVVLLGFCVTSTIAFSQIDSGVRPSASTTASCAKTKEKRVALVIGNTNYTSKQWTKLQTPRNDAEEIAVALCSVGFDVTVEFDLGSDAFRETLSVFSRKMQGADVALFYYAGHGMAFNGENYLLPVDSVVKRPEDLPTQTITLKRVLAALETKVKLRIVILDSCRDTGISQHIAAEKRAGFQAGAASQKGPDGTIIGYAAKLGFTALDRGPNPRHSPYAYAFLRHIRDAGIDISRFFRRVKRTVREATSYQQKPTFTSERSDDTFQFVPAVASDAEKIDNPVRDLARLAFAKLRSKPKVARRYFGSAKKLVTDEIRDEGTQSVLLSPNAPDFMHALSGHAQSTIAVLDQVQEARRRELRADLFDTLQWEGYLNSSVTRTLYSTAVIRRLKNKELRQLARRQQLLQNKLWDARRGQRVTRSTAPMSTAPIAEGSAADIQTELQQVLQKIKNRFPNEATQLLPHAESLVNIQKALADDEALLVYSASANHPIVVAISKTSFKAHQVSATTEAIGDKIGGFLKQLDENSRFSAQTRGFLPVSAARSKTGLANPEQVHLAKDARGLYDLLVRPVQTVLCGACDAKSISKKHVMLVGAGPIQLLPFQALLTGPLPADPEAAADLAKWPWLIKRHALSVLPSVHQIKTARDPAAKAARKLPRFRFIGFGNPLVGDAAIQARSPLYEVKLRQSGTSPGNPNAMPNLRTWFSSVPGSATEIEGIARALEVPQGHVHLGDAARESRLKILRLEEFSIISFATHSVRAGQFPGLKEPGLLMSPPPFGRRRSPELVKLDNGILTASEIVDLKLNAELVLLSACRTAGGGQILGDAFSGLPRAFLQAGARALLVTHWDIGDDSAILLSTRFVKKMKQEKGIRYALALQTAILALMQEPGRPEYSHPRVWAPYTLMGDGGQASRLGRRQL
jgi:CHAT domain-containing protein